MLRSATSQIGPEIRNDNQADQDQHYDGSGGAQVVPRRFKRHIKNKDAGHVRGKSGTAAGHRKNKVENLERDMSQNDSRAHCDRLQQRKNNFPINLDLGGSINPSGLSEIAGYRGKSGQIHRHGEAAELPRCRDNHWNHCQRNAQLDAHALYRREDVPEPIVY